MAGEYIIGSFIVECGSPYLPSQYALLTFGFPSRVYSQDIKRLEREQAIYLDPSVDVRAVVRRNICHFRVLSQKSQT